MTKDNSKIKVGQICWTCGGHVHDSLNARLVKVTHVGRQGAVKVKLINPTEDDIFSSWQRL